MQNIPFTALDKDAGQVDVVRRSAARSISAIRRAPTCCARQGPKTAKVLVIALDEMDATLQVAAIAKRNFPHLAVFARARNRRHVLLLLDIGVAGIIRETFFSSLRMTEMVLEALGTPPESARRAIELFREHDERNLLATHAIAGDEQQLIQSSQQAAQELLELFEADRGDRSPPAQPAEAD
ncbi:MAG: NAD-binding protein [Pseudomonadota bacterium]